MTELIRQQIFAFVVIFYAGGVSAFLLKIYLRFKREVPVGRSTTILQNILFWVFLALIVNTFVDFASDGKIAFYNVITYILGWLAAIAFDKFANS